MHVYLKKDTIYFDGVRYYIRLTDITTPDQLIAWMNHIAEKPWGDDDTVDQLKELVCRKNKIKLGD
jgi:hypothetical protein